ncbi:putative Zn-dependent peptidase [Salibacterium salarium]|uniref:M16 family metallopeptidase n=1 Tax=Salibacterium salarium TaxID=284579 RepID=UPI002788E047|nr:pitrilysin family protein [Salibacterium salarium]MDQ0299182.1 putative Zn-dependent peptidase [Salibacterium salarium]
MVQTRTLTNGLRIVTEDIPTVRSMTIGIWIGSGSRYESAEENGVSHFLEHMFFKGTSTRTASEIAESFDKIGGHVNAFTSKEYTCFYAKVLDQHAKKALSILGDMLFYSTFDEIELEKERQVIAEEIKMVDDTPDDIIHDYLDEASFGNHPLGRPILGTEETIQTFTRNSLIKHMDRCYTADNIVISLAGNKTEEVMEHIESLFGGLPSRPNHVERSIVAPSFLTGKTAKQKETEQAHLCLGFPGLPADHEDIYSLTLLNNALGGSMSSRLFQSIREEKGLAYSVFSYHAPFIDSGLLTIYAGSSLEQLDEMYEATMAAIQDVKAKGLTVKELENGKEQLKGNIMLGLESTSSKMSRNGKNELMLGHHRPLDEVIQRIEAVGLEDIKKTAEYVFQTDYSLSLISREGTYPTTLWQESLL